MIWIIFCAAVAAVLTAAALFIYSGRDRPARRPHRAAAQLALGASWGLLAVNVFLFGESERRWLGWSFAVLAVATPVTIWEERRKAARKENKD